jgi:hypothetical protein
LEQLDRLTGFTVPQLVQLTSRGPVLAVSSAPEARRFASTRSPPHWTQIFAMALLRVPQYGQTKSAPAWAA